MSHPNPTFDPYNVLPEDKEDNEDMAGAVLEIEGEEPDEE